jgi:hypothetical protein
MKKLVRAVNFSIRFYKKDGWTRDCLEQYLVKGRIRDTEYSRRADPPHLAYFAYDLDSDVDLLRLYENEVGSLDRIDAADLDKSNFDIFVKYINHRG